VTTSLDDSSERRRREAEFHDQWASEIDPGSTLVDESFTSVTAVENQFIVESFGDLRGKRVLDYGCGAAEGGIYFAKLGAEVVGVDVSPGMLQAAERLAAHHDVSIETRRVESDRIPGEDAEFDFIYGNGVLHHVELDKARPELARILKPSGKACFIEPLTYNPVIEVYRRMASTVRTDDERPLKFPDIERFHDYFGSVEHREFWLLTLSVFLKFFLVDRAHPAKERYWKKIYTDAERVRWFFEPLRRTDDKLLRALPPLRRLCWNTVITLAEPLARSGRGESDPRAA
jgi:SAM-dependent methyltransferase